PTLLTHNHISHCTPDCQREPAGKSHISYFYNHSRAFVKIQDGCDAFCSYCIVPFVRPKLYNKPREVVFEEIQSLVRNGYKSIVLCGIRLGKYRDTTNNSNFTYGLTELVEDILKLESQVQIEFSSLEIGEISEQLIELIASKKNRIIRHLHIPLQSADNKILKLQKRPYTVEEFQDKLDRIRYKITDISITTDVMVGFPTETREQFENTMKFITQNKFSKLHIFRYSDRPKTLASSFLPKVPSQEVKLRAKKLLQKNY
ncbi:MAG: radical SAM protein, partial [Elusimicrobiota bacterium]|nr:radical SAM protein [Elusimicrobiota bacterium]